MEVSDPLEFLIVCLCVLSVLILCSISDLRERRIPNRVLIAGTATVIISLTIISPEVLPGRLLWAVLIAMPFMVISLLKPEAMGMGDAKLIFFLGIALGYLAGEVVLVALVIGGIVGLSLILRRGKAARKATIPFAPFLAAGAAVVGLGTAVGVV